MKHVPVHIKHKYPGSWLFSRKILEWLFISGLRKQLPILFKLFSYYAEYYFILTNNDYLRGGRRLFLFLSAINKIIFRTEFSIIQLPDIQICIDLTDPRFLNVINELLNKKSDTGLLSLLLNKGDTFIDVGANHGSFSLIASRIVKKDGLIIAIEPQPRLSYAIEQSFNINDIKKYQVYQTAVGNTNGDVTFLIPTDTSGTAGSYPVHSATHHHKKITVPITTLDKLVDWPTCPGHTMIKVDIEGGEFKFLQGANEIIHRLNPIMLMEINPKSLNASDTKKEELIELLYELGFRWFAETQSPEEKIELRMLNTEIFKNLIFYTS